RFTGGAGAHGAVGHEGVTEVWVSVTAPHSTAKNRVTGKQIDKNSGPAFFSKSAKCLILNDIQKLARCLLYLSYNNKKNAIPNKNNR
ncbi:hypothetical protein QWI17_16585, partial [Gilvimarinus sp. SDUM040013]|nr:hypothetical protein [Gilvimarinus sp. SDUM040013]